MAHEAVHNLAPPFSTLSLSLGPLQPTDLLSLQHAKQILVSLHLLLSSALHLYRCHLHRETSSHCGVHTATLPSWMSFLLYLSTAHSPNTVCRLPPQCYLGYLFLFLSLSAEDRIQGLALSKHSATKPHPQALHCCPLSLPFSLVTFPGMSTPGFCPAFLMPLAPQLGVPTFCPLHTAPSTQERPNGSLQK